jgi:hypothetical protein
MMHCQVDVLRFDIRDLLSRITRADDGFTTPLLLGAVYHRSLEMFQYAKHLSEKYEFGSMNSGSGTTNPELELHLQSSGFVVPDPEFFRGLL